MKEIKRVSVFLKQSVVVPVVPTTTVLGPHLTADI